MKPFIYLSPTTSDEAIGMLDEHGPGAHVIAGGQSLLLTMKTRIARPEALVSLGGISDLSGVRPRGTNGFVVGATTTYATLARTTMSGWHGEISRMAGDLADRPVRTMGTIGGALCAADPRFDMVTLVIGVGARLEVLSPSGLRLVQPHEFFRASGGTSLRPNEILTAIHFPSSEAFTAVAFEKFRQRTFDAAVISVLCALRVSDDGTVSEARLAVGSATPVPTLGSECAARLVGRPINDIDPAAVGDGVCNEVLDQRAGGSSLVQYQRELIRALTRKAFIRATITGRS